MSQPKILIVDDDYRFAEFAKMLLESIDYQAIVCEDAAEVLEEARQYRPDLILIDFSMPDLTGVDAAKLLKSDPQLKEIPIILCSVTKRREEIDGLGESGVAAFLPKPLEVEVLKLQIEKILGERGKRPDAK